MIREFYERDAMVGDTHIGNCFSGDELDGLDHYDTIYFERRPRKMVSRAYINHILLELGACLEGATCPVPAFYGDKSPGYGRVKVVHGTVPYWVKTVTYKPGSAAVSGTYLDWSHDIIFARRNRKLVRHESIRQSVRVKGGRLK